MEYLQQFRRWMAPSGCTSSSYFSFSPKGVEEGGGGGGVVDSMLLHKLASLFSVEVVFG